MRPARPHRRTSAGLERICSQPRAGGQIFGPIIRALGVGSIPGSTASAGLERVLARPGQPCQLGAHHHLQAHHADRLLAAKGADLDGGPDLEAPYADLAARVADGTLRVEVEAAYPIEEIKAALAHAEREGRGGKSLVMPDRPVDVAARPCEMALGGAAGPPDAPTRDFC